MKFSENAGNEWASEQMIKFWWRSGSRIWIWIRFRMWIATLVRRPWRRYALRQCL